MITSMKQYERLKLGALATNCWILTLETPSLPPHPCIVIDPGDEGAKIVEHLQSLNCYPASILLTHGHYDHVAALPDLVHGPEAEIAIHGMEAQFLGPQSYREHRTLFTAIGLASYVDQLWHPLPSPTRLLQDGDAIGPLQAIHVPGHSPGSLAFYWESQGVLFSGDTLFRSSVGRTDLPGSDPAALSHSLQKLLDLDEDTIVCPGHGPATTIKAERHT